MAIVNQIAKAFQIPFGLSLFFVHAFPTFDATK